MKVAAEVYFRGELAIVATLSRGSASEKGGPWLIQPPYTAVSLADTHSSKLGALVLDALGRSGSGVPWPEDWEVHAQPLVNAAGVPTWDALMVGASHVFVERDGDALVFVPSNNDGSGFESKRKLALREVSNATADLVGATLLEARALCTSVPAEPDE